MIQSSLKYIFSSLFTIPLLPFLFLQGKRIKSSVPSLPEAKGTSGKTKNHTNRSFRLITIGESTIAGVGVETHQDGFTGALAESLSQHLNKTIEWKVYAKSGYTVNRVTHEIIPKIEENDINLIVVGMGGNDAFALNSPWKWRKDITSLVLSIKAKFGDTPITFTNMPPIKDFPAFTYLIKLIMGNLVELYRDELISICQTFPNVYFSDETIKLSDWIERLDHQYEPSDFFSDGVHPSKLTYQTWGNEMVNFVSNKLK